MTGVLAMGLILLLSIAIAAMLGRLSIGGIVVGTYAAIFLCGTSCVIFDVRARRQLRTVLVNAQGFVCHRCHYPLTSLPDEGQCPECGTLYTRADIVQLWKRTHPTTDDWPTTGKSSPPHNRQ